MKVTERICGHFIITAVPDDRGWSIFRTYRNIVGWREAGNSLSCLQQREVVHTRFPVCSVLPLCRADSRNVSSGVCRAEISPPRLIPLANTNAWFNPLWFFVTLISPSISPRARKEASPIQLSVTLPPPPSPTLHKTLDFKARSNCWETEVQLGLQK